ncbi:glucokinase [Paracoccus halophilus]|uniref:Glucokinase n=1 Tax=Paracoccus halophilus TaxID=376733 RepID=A0A099EZF7_9RHOB|nr:glucokinase [Paracoccus halophilus]KGJ03366.1 glucokinase [Paracoccus halophilus]SFA58890.1 glucokinase [Paracoccus halophilus]
MTFLLADVGGTNARLALARDGAIDGATITRFLGDDHGSFDEVVRLYLDQQGGPRINAVCVDVAGPVSGGAARLTNRDWDFTETRLRDLTGAPRARLINDLLALGYATPALDGDAAGFLRVAPQGSPGNGQRLVVNAGTGFNVCAVKVLPGGGIACLESEEGHTRLPYSVRLALARELGDEATDPLDSVEELFAGRGLAKLHALRTGQAAVRAEAVCAAAAQGDAAAEASCALYARLFGLLCRELALRFMPLEGMFLAGSVARSCTDRFEIFEQAFLSDPLMARIVQAVPIGVIRDDMAALHGCLAALA